MASNVTLLTVRTLVRQRTHYENSQFVTDSELNAFINGSLKELYDILITAFEGYAVSSQDNTIASANLIALPATFYKLLGVDLITQLPDQLQTLPRVGWQERNSSRRGYDLRGSNVVITPYSWAAGQSFRLYYVPVISTLALDADAFDGVDGWEDYVIADACIKVLAKAERDASIFMAQKQGLLDRISAASKNRDAGEPPHVSDVRSQGEPGVIVGGRWLYDAW